MTEEAAVASANRRIRGGAACGLAVAAALAWCGPALAWPGVVSWPTYYRTGPDRQYRVLNELERGVPVEVLSCANGWCQVQTSLTTGYVEESAISHPEQIQPKPAVQAEGDGCFDSHETGYGKGETWRYCPR